MMVSLNLFHFLDYLFFILLDELYIGNWFYSKAKKYKEIMISFIFMKDFNSCLKSAKFHIFKKLLIINKRQINSISRRIRFEHLVKYPTTIITYRLDFNSST